MKWYLLTGVTLIVLIILVPLINNGILNTKLQNEIERVADKSGINSDSTRCSNVEFAQVCYAEYSSLNSENAKRMLVNSGYKLVDEKYNRDDKLSATNQATKIRVDSERVSAEDAALTLKFKDIDVTL